MREKLWYWQGSLEDIIYRYVHNYDMGMTNKVIRGIETKAKGLVKTFMRYS